MLSLSLYMLFFLNPSQFSARSQCMLLLVNDIFFTSVLNNKINNIYMMLRSISIPYGIHVEPAVVRVFGVEVQHAFDEFALAIRQV